MCTWGQSLTCSCAPQLSSSRLISSMMQMQSLGLLRHAPHLHVGFGLNWDISGKCEAWAGGVVRDEMRGQVIGRSEGQRGKRWAMQVGSQLRGSEHAREGGLCGEECAWMAAACRKLVLCSETELTLCKLNRKS